jgi:alpha-tubulin suppressor-like RCC1 family protein
VGITTTGEAYAWGFNDYGQLGDGTVTTRTTPVLVSGGHRWASIAAGYEHTAGVTTTGEAYAWGRNNYAQLGDGTKDNHVTPVLISPRP